MATYFVGDIQGCFDELMAVLDKVDFNPSRDQLWAVGDLVARGEGSLETLRYLRSLGESAQVVLGNHDLHLLAVQKGLKRANPKDKLQSLLKANDLPGLIDWLRAQPLYRFDESSKLIMTHAGVPPHWNLQKLQLRADAVSEVLQSDDYIEHLISQMYTDNVADDRGDMTELEHHIYCINALTRMRYLLPNGHLDFACKMPPEQVDDPALSPWFTYASETHPKYTLVFGHWAALMGNVPSESLHALDTGCCWGEHLTLWHKEADQKITQKRLKKS
ncbi:symmetrical bis(5'-nucleosyl)-tetraphosphatase [Shewanella waksmanii]|uniref:symmetrical bis(5'-nucleosyl)-tetraphosphatase n=1 Tax=Shewanella waksmanii TaxID=213783 RepID=UPI00048B15E0|nr:symmetrical bis(5'-nucleosyl)-tetraphosphatase [Shewanella waksmanii]